MRILRTIIFGVIFLTSIIFSYESLAKVTLLGIPKNPTTPLYVKHPVFLEKLERFLDVLEGREEAFDKLYELTPDEAFQYFHSYVEERFGKEKADQINPQLFTSRFFGMNREEIRIRHNTYRARPESRDSFQTYLTKELIQDIYKTAKRIMDNTKRGEVLVVFGNSPALIGKALEKLVSKNPEDMNYRKLIWFAFSGSPNGIRNVPHTYSIVTPERLDHLKKRIEKSALMSKELLKHKVYFIDAIGSGGGLSYVMGEILHFFKEVGDKLPDLNVISINEIEVGKRHKPRNSWICHKSAWNGETFTFYFPNLMMPQFSVTGIVLGIDQYETLDRLPSEDYRVVPEYYPCHWHESYDYILTLPLSSKAQEFLDYFEAELQGLIEGDLS